MRHDAVTLTTSSQRATNSELVSHKGTRWQDSRLGNTLKIGMVSHSALTTRSTAVTSLVITPLLEVLLLVAVLTSAGVANLRDATYASILLAFGLSVLSGTVGEVTYDRQIGVAQEVIGHGMWNWSYWLGKLFVPMLLGIMPTLLSAVAVFLIDGFVSASAQNSIVNWQMIISYADAESFTKIMLLIPLAAITGALVGITAAVASFALEDPYLVSNIANSVLLITAGVVLSLSLYPSWLAWPARLLPFTALIEAVRSANSIVPLILRELGVSLAWLAVGLLIGKRVLNLIRAGKRSQEVW